MEKLLSLMLYIPVSEGVKYNISNGSF